MDHERVKKKCVQQRVIKEIPTDTKAFGRHDKYVGVYIYIYGAKNQNSLVQHIKPVCGLGVFVDAGGAGILCAGEDHV